ETLALDAESVTRQTRARARAAVLVHPFGLPVRLEPFSARGLLIVEDCTQAPGSHERGQPDGSRGGAAVFSFATTKMATCVGRRVAGVATWSAGRSPPASSRP